MPSDTISSWFLAAQRNFGKEKCGGPRTVIWIRFRFTSNADGGEERGEEKAKEEAGEVEQRDERGRTGARGVITI